MNRNAGELQMVASGLDKKELAKRDKLTAKNFKLKATADGKGWAIVKCKNKKAWCLEIAEAFKGLPILEIGERAFQKHYCVEKIVIPDTVTVIRKWAFEDCVNLTDISVGKGVKCIENCASAGCKRLTNIYIFDLAAWCEMDVSGLTVFCADDIQLYCDGVLLKKLVLPDGVKAVGRSAFYMCNSITNVTVPEGVEELAPNAFRKCKRLTGVTLPTTLKRIGYQAFMKCGQLTGIELPKGLVAIEADAFADCTNLTRIVYQGSVQEFLAIKGCHICWQGVPATEVLCCDGTVT